MTIAFSGARISDGEGWHVNSVLIVEGDTVLGIAESAPSDAERVGLDGGYLIPGFVDLQVNGGGGLLLNDAPTVETIETICRALRKFGTTALLPTLITDTREVTMAALRAGAEAARANIPGFLGLHLEGPHLSVARKGAHDPALIRPMEEEDLHQLVAARRTLPNLLVTVAAETVRPEQIRRLAGAGIVVSIGHSDAAYETARAAFAAGASMATHLFNAMSQMGNREPGVVGATLDTGPVWAGLIADGHHVHPATVRAALRGKAGPGRIFLVSDAMAVTGTAIDSFTLNGRTIFRRDGALRLADGTLAGADLTMLDAVRFAHRIVGLSLEEAIRTGTADPARALGVGERFGMLTAGARSDLVHLASDLTLKSAWVGGGRNEL